MRTPLLDDIARAQIDRRLKDAEAAASLTGSRRPWLRPGITGLLGMLPLRRSAGRPARMPVFGDPAYRA